MTHETREQREQLNAAVFAALQIDLNLAARIRDHIDGATFEFTHITWIDCTRAGDSREEMEQFISRLEATLIHKYLPRGNRSLDLVALRGERAVHTT